MSWYNGYSQEERDAKWETRKERPELMQPLSPPCDLCGDPSSPVKPHSEDYSQPYSWERGVAVFALCGPCDARLHKRFSNLQAWLDLLHFVKLGYYGREISVLAAKARRGKAIAGAPGRESRQLPYIRYWESRTTDPKSLTSAWARPRP